MELPKMQEEQLQYITQRIIDTILAEYIYCYGVRIAEEKTWGNFRPAGGYSQMIRTAYDLLIITPADYSDEDHVALQLVKQQFTSPISVNCVVGRVNHINEQLKAKSRFHHQVIKYGRELYHPAKESLANKDEIPPFPATTEWDRWYKQAQHFYHIGNYALSQKMYGQAIFLYHQVIENACAAMLRFFTGYTSTTHNVGQLLTLTETFSNLPRSIFPGTTKEELEINNALVRAYSESRYKESYDIAPSTVDTIKERVKALLSVTEDLCKKGLKALDDPATAYISTLKAK